MKKSELMELIESYHGEINSEPLISQTPYQKGWVKKLFDTQTEGIAKLQIFFRSDSMSKLSLEDEIDSDNLLALLEIMDMREQRIQNTRRSYENSPEKSTNRVYNRLYHLLLLDAALQADIGIQFAHTNALNQLLFNRVTHKIFANLEERAKKTNELANNPQEANADYLALSLALIFGEYLNHQFDNQEEILPEGLTSHPKIIYFNEQSIQVEFNFLNGALHTAKLIHAVVKCQQNVDAGLEWLKLGSDKGDKKASLHLAAFYARRYDYHFVNKITEPDKTIEYLNLAAQQGSTYATHILTLGLTFGNVSLETEDETYRATH